MKNDVEDVAAFSIGLQIQTALQELSNVEDVGKLDIFKGVVKNPSNSLNER